MFHDAKTQPPKLTLQRETVRTLRFKTGVKTGRVTDSASCANDTARPSGGVAIMQPAVP